MSQLPQPLKAALLYDDPLDRLPDWTGLTGRLGTGFRLVEAFTSETRMVASDGVVRVRVTVHDQPLPRADFAEVIDLPLYGGRHPERVAGIVAHRAAVVVEVTHAGEQRESRKALLRRIDVCRRMAGGIARLAQPRVVHWTQSNQLLPGDEFVSLAGSRMPLALYVQPGIFMAEGRKGERLYGIEANGAAVLVGRHLRFAPHAQAPEASYAAVLAYIEACRSEARPARAGDVLKAESGGAIEVVEEDGALVLHQRGKARAKAPAPRPAARSRAQAMAQKAPRRSLGSHPAIKVARKHLLKVAIVATLAAVHVTTEGAWIDQLAKYAVDLSGFDLTAGL